MHAVPARGIVFGGLRPARAMGPCHGQGFEVALADGQTACTHGPDPSPPGIDVRHPRSVEELRAGSLRLSRATASQSSLPCIGDGTSGNRVQAIYAYASDHTDRYATIAPLIQGWAVTNVQDVVHASAAEVGGAVRDVRFVTDANCKVVVQKAALSKTGDDTFQNTINELAAKGFADPHRKYLVWVDANVYCGMAQIYVDDKPGQDNYNNGTVPGMVARVDSGCWGLATGAPAEAHELVHTLGAVMTSAPHSTSMYHCTDDYDVMCYADGSGATVKVLCTDPGHERRLDCNHDDYFNPAPAPGSYLAGHWNVANSSFLQGPAPPAAPAIEGFTPGAAAVGKGVVITGSGFTGATALKFNGVAQPVFTVVSDVEIDADVPSGALTGPVVVTGPGGTGASATAFGVRPKVGSFSPVSGLPGISVTILGSAFTGATVVKFGGLKAMSFTVVSYSAIVAVVPAGAVTGRIAVVTAGGTGKSIADFTVV